jgi:hypothetical protein
MAEQGESFHLECLSEQWYSSPLEYHSILPVRKTPMFGSASHDHNELFTNHPQNFWHSQITPKIFYTCIKDPIFAEGM